MSTTARTKSRSTPTNDAFSDSLTKFLGILKKYEKRCLVDTDHDNEYYLNFKPTEPDAKPKFFAGTGINKATISYYLAPIHDPAALRARLSPSLKKHLSGKCCFRFKKSEPIPFDELAALTKDAFELHLPNRRASE